MKATQLTSSKPSAMTHGPASSSSPEHPSPEMLLQRLLPHHETDPRSSVKTARSQIPALISHIQGFMLRGDLETEASLRVYRHVASDQQAVDGYVGLTRLLAKVYKQHDIIDLMHFSDSHPLAHEHWSAVSELLLDELLAHSALDLKGVFKQSFNSPNAFNSAMTSLAEFNKLHPSRAKVTLDHCEFTSDQFDSLSRLIGEGCIGELSLKSCKLQSQQANLLNAAAAKSSLPHTVDLSDNQIDQDSAMELVKTIASKPFARLDLRGNSIDSRDTLLKEASDMADLRV